MLAVFAAVVGLGYYGSKVKPTTNVEVYYPAGCLLVEPQPYATHPDEAMSMVHAPYGKTDFVFLCGDGRYKVQQEVTVKKKAFRIEPLEEGKLLARNDK